uniref:Pleckstrin homology domain containing B2 n=1 Tax=Otolemur garnettii TaxID=30611 RepID=H0XRM1_OTOGA
MMIRPVRVSRTRSTCQWITSTSAPGTNVGIFSLQKRNQKTVTCRLFAEKGKISLCTESTDDRLAWKFTLQDSRTNTAYVGSAVMTDETPVVSSSPPYTVYATPTPEAYGYGPYGGAYPPGTQVVYAATGQAYAVPYGQHPTNQVICERYRDDSDLALGMLAGVAMGMALGSLFWVF